VTPHSLGLFYTPFKGGVCFKQRHADITCSVKRVLEENDFSLLTTHTQTGQKAIRLAGGVALNCIATGYDPR